MPDHPVTGHTEGLLLDSEEHGVDELDVLEVVVDHVVELETLEMDYEHATGDKRR